MRVVYQSSDRTERKKLIEDYSVVLASTQKLGLELLRQNFNEIIALKEIDPNYSLEPLQKTLGTDGLKELKKIYPFFILYNFPHSPLKSV